MDIEKAMSRTWMEIDEDAVLHNYRLALSLCKEGVALVPVLKANAYGLGLARIGRLLWDAGAREFAVATADEALRLRETLPQAQILVMGAVTAYQLPELIARDVMVTVGTLQNAMHASEAAQACGKKVQAQLKIDTGLHRLGFESVQEMLPALALPGIEYVGLYSHLALRSDEQSKMQYAAFQRIEEELRKWGYGFEKRHLLDSIGLTRYPDWQMTAVRIGAFLYGNAPGDWKRLKECRETVRFCTRVTRLAWVKQGEGIGYDEEPIEKDLRIATVACGYVDGYSRQLSGVGKWKSGGNGPA